MACSYVKMPSAISDPKYKDSSLKLNDLTVAQSFYFINEKKGSVFMETHCLYFVKRGTSVITNGNVSFEVKKNQMLLLSKAVLFDYHKKADETGIFENLFFFLTDEFITEFVKMASLPVKRIIEPVLPSVKTVNERLKHYFDSISGYFNSQEKIEPGLLRLKLMELLYELTNMDQNLLLQLMQMKQQVPVEISRVVENNYLKPVSLEELAYLAGRSLASFKRDFSRTYNASPAAWIRRKRLDKASELLTATSMSVSDICYSTGFENTAHFSKLYKETFGVTPSSLRN